MCSYRNICEANITRLIEYIHIETCKACNIVKKKENHIAFVYNNNKKPKNTECLVAFLKTLTG